MFFKYMCGERVIKIVIFICKHNNLFNIYFLHFWNVNHSLPILNLTNMVQRNFPSVIQAHLWLFHPDGLGQWLSTEFGTFSLINAAFVVVGDYAAGDAVQRHVLPRSLLGRAVLPADVHPLDAEAHSAALVLVDRLLLAGHESPGLQGVVPGPTVGLVHVGDHIGVVDFVVRGAHVVIAPLVLSLRRQGVTVDEGLAVPHHVVVGHQVVIFGFAVEVTASPPDRVRESGVDHGDSDALDLVKDVENVVDPHLELSLGKGVHLDQTVVSVVHAVAVVAEVVSVDVNLGLLRALAG